MKLLLFIVIHAVCVCRLKRERHRTSKRVRERERELANERVEFKFVYRIDIILMNVYMIYINILSERQIARAAYLKTSADDAQLRHSSCEDSKEMRFSIN